MTTTATKVPVGLSTAFGLSTSTAAFIAAIVAAASGDRTPETLAAIGAGVVTGAAVILSRGRQAVAQIHSAPFPLSACVGELAPARPSDPVAAALSAGVVTGQLTVSVAPPAPETGPEAVA